MPEAGNIPNAIIADGKQKFEVIENSCIPTIALEI
jgi:hypothetical protein